MQVSRDYGTLSLSFTSALFADRGELARRAQVCEENRGAGAGTWQNSPRWSQPVAHGGGGPCCALAGPFESNPPTLSTATSPFFRHIA